MTEPCFLAGTEKIFIHIPKNAGTAIATQIGTCHPGHHITVRNIPKEHRSKAVAIVRNPFDRIISIYEYCKKLDSYWHTVENPPPLYEFCSTHTFEEFVTELCKGNFDQVDWHFKKQFYWVVDDNYNIECNIVHFENIENELSEVLGKPVKLNKINSTTKEQKEYYTVQTKKLVYEYFAKDFELFYPDEVVYWRPKQIPGWGNVVMCLNDLVMRYGKIRVHPSVIDVARGVSFSDKIKFIDCGDENFADPKILINQYYHNHVNININKIIKPTTHVIKKIQENNNILEGVVAGLHIRRGAHSQDSSKMGCSGINNDGSIIPCYYADDEVLKKFEKIIVDSSGPVFIASDSKEVKTTFIRKYPEKVRIFDNNIVLTYKHEKLDSVNISDDDRLDCYVEWFMLSQCPIVHITGGDLISTYGYSAACYGLKNINIVA